MIVKKYSNSGICIVSRDFTKRIDFINNNDVDKTTRGFLSTPLLTLAVKLKPFRMLVCDEQKRPTNTGR